MSSVEEIQRSLLSHVPEVRGVPASPRAAVALVLRAPDESARPDVLLIERARHEGDPWSGHMAFPGGRVDAGDATDRAAAERETLEEVGVHLDAARYLGHLGDLEGRHAGRRANLVISAHVYHVMDPEPLRPNYEVAEAFWFPLRELASTGRHVDYAPYQGILGTMPGICVGDPERQIVWGLTYRFLEVFFEALGRPLR